MIYNSTQYDERRTLSGMALSFAILVGVGVVAISPIVGAAELDYTMRVAIGHSDNIRRLNDGNESEEIASVGLDLDWSENTRMIDADLKTNLQFRSYLGNTFDDEIFGTAEINSNVQLIPQILDWFVEDRFGQILRDRFQADTPGNREDVNTFTTGFDASLNLGARSSISVLSQFQNQYYEESRNGNDQLLARLTMSRALSTVRSVSLNVQAERIEFDDELLDRKYDRISAYVGFSSQGARSTLVLKAGVNEVHDNGETRDSALASFAVTREISRRTSVMLSHNISFSDSGNLFREFGARDVGSFQTPSTDASSEPFESKRTSLGLEMTGASGRAYFRLSYDDEDYLDSSILDRTSSAVDVGFSRDVVSGWTMSAAASYQKREFSEPERKDDDIQVSASLTKRLTRRLSLSLGYLRTYRDSGMDSFEFTENRYDLGLNFSPVR